MQRKTKDKKLKIAMWLRQNKSITKKERTSIIIRKNNPICQDMKVLNS